MKKNEAQSILATTANNLLANEVGESAKQYTLVLGRYESASILSKTPIDEDEGWTVLALHSPSVQMHAGIIQCGRTRVIETSVSSIGNAAIGATGTPIAGIWQWGAD
jgi:hypothetical protein